MGEPLVHIDDFRLVFGDTAVIEDLLCRAGSARMDAECHRTAGGTAEIADDQGSAAP